ncbi:E4 [Canis familiaris papillomavirus 14]|uniref:E4 n=1 Tax=Canis familiaris papillomavirus 14 TaxID=1236767 RepID=K7QKH2_9PAPI|nr:E4 [Canis familiaris papillomavirus 14]AFU07674.1 E4 [Canis familiaris papillomavirus 14]
MEGELAAALHRPPTLVERLNYILDGTTIRGPLVDEPETGERNTSRGRRRRNRRRQTSSPPIAPPHTPPLSPTVPRTPRSPYPSLVGGLSDSPLCHSPLSQWELPPSQRQVTRRRSRGQSPPSSRGPPESEPEQEQEVPTPPGASGGLRAVNLPSGSPRYPRTNPFWCPSPEIPGWEVPGSLSTVGEGLPCSPGPLRSRQQTPDHWDPLPRPEEVSRRRRRPRLQQQHENLRTALKQLSKDAFQLREDIEADLNTFFGKLGIAPQRL